MGVIQVVSLPGFGQNTVGTGIRRGLDLGLERVPYGVVPLTSSQSAYFSEK